MCGAAGRFTQGASHWGVTQADSRSVRHAGCVTLGASRWVRHAGCVTLGASRWVHHAGCVMQAASHWVHHAGCIMLGVSRWVHHTGCITLGASRWVHHAGCVTPGAPSWVRQWTLCQAGFRLRASCMTSQRLCVLGCDAAPTECSRTFRLWSESLVPPFWFQSPDL